MAYAERLALLPQQAHSVAVYAMLPMLARSPRFVTVLVTEFTVWSVTFKIQETCSLRAVNVLWRTLPKSQEQRFGASSGAGQKGIGSMALGQMAKYCWTKSWYSHE